MADGAAPRSLSAAAGYGPAPPSPDPRRAAADASICLIPCLRLSSVTGFMMSASTTSRCSARCSGVPVMSPTGVTGQMLFTALTTSHQLMCGMARSVSTRSTTSPRSSRARPSRPLPAASTACPCEASMRATTSSTAASSSMRSILTYPHVSSRGRPSVTLARPLDAAALRAEEHVERREASVAPGDVAVELELFLRGEGRVRVDLLLEDPEAVADAENLLEEGLDRHFLGLDVGLARDETEGAARPPGSELQVHIDPAVLAEDLPDGLPDAVGLSVPLALVDLAAVEAEGDELSVAAAEDDNVLTGLVGDDAADAELEMADDRPDP